MAEQIPQYNFGDLVKVNGYWPRIFQVDGKRTELWQYPDEEWTDVVYELYDVANNDWIEAIDEDLTFVADAAQADEYLRANPAPMTKSTTMDLSHIWPGMKSTVIVQQAPAKPTRDEKAERAAKIDELLDQRNWYSGALERTNNEDFGDRIMAIDCELKRLVGDD
jgi:hypothetical protein